MKISKKNKKLPLDYVLKLNIPAKFGDEQSIFRQRKLGMMNLTDRHTNRQTDRQTDFFSLVYSRSYRSETHPIFFFMSIEENHNGSGVP